jgi:antitoxin CcdA
MRMKVFLSTGGAGDPKVVKKAVNLTINRDLLAAARELNINLSSTMETALIDAVRHQQRERWLADNRAAIAAYNKRVEEGGVFSDGIRSF